MHSIYPLFAYRDPMEVWAHEPTFLVAEIVTTALTVALLILAALQGRKHIFVLFASFFGGALIELFTIMEPQIGNFYHSQSSLMLFGKREPVYMLACYVLVQFLSVVLPWNSKFPALAESCFAGLLSTFFFGILDAVGLKMLWWVWHSSEPMYVDRNMGVPLASAIWIMLSTACLNLVLRSILKSTWFDRLPLAAVCILGALAGPFATLVVMNIPFLIFYHPVVTYMGYPSWWVLLGLRLVSFLAVVSALWSAKKLSFAPNWPLLIISLLYITTFVLITVFGDPTTVVRTSYTQPYGDCATKESSFWGGFQRGKYVCAANIDPLRDQYQLCNNTPAADADWYSVCGTPITADWWAQIVYYFAASYALVLLAQLRASETLHPKKE